MKSISKPKAAKKYPFEGFRPEPDVQTMINQAVRFGIKKSDIFNCGTRLFLQPILKHKKLSAK